MRLNPVIPALLGVSSLPQLSDALPFLHFRSGPVKDLLRRATYSVVLVDGGSSQTQAPEETVVQTITHTPPPRTTTILQTESVILPPVTEQVLTTKTLDGPKQTQTVVVEVTPTPEIVATATSYSVIDIADPSTSTKVILSSTSRQSASSSSTAQPVSSSSIASTFEKLSTTTRALTATSTSSSFQATKSSTSEPASTTSQSITSASEPTLTSTFALTTPTPSTSTSTYDDGLWKTTYPPWNDTMTSGMWRRGPRATPISRPVHVRLLSNEVNVERGVSETRSRTVFARFLANFRI